MADRKFKDLVHYICWKCQDPTKLGAIKLNKILWYVDRIAYESLGRAITGEKYIKRRLGPVPKSILPALNELRDEKAIVTRDVDFYGKPKREFFALRPAPLDTFNPQEISLIDEVIETICDGHTAQSISDLSHDVVWQAAREGEEIPLSAAAVSNPAEITEADWDWAASVIGRDNAPNRPSDSVSDRRS